MDVALHHQHIIAPLLGLRVVGRSDLLLGWDHIPQCLKLSDGRRANRTVKALAVVESLPALDLVRQLLVIQLVQLKRGIELVESGFLNRSTLPLRWGVRGLIGRHLMWC